MQQLHFQPLTSAPAHQFFLTRLLTHELSKKLSRSNFEVVNEAYINAERIDCGTADIIIYSKKDLRPLILVEFTDDAMQKITMNSLELICDIYGIYECFMYNYQSSTWFRCIQGTFGKSGKSLLMDFDMNDILQNGLRQYSAVNSY
jgi:hypothetical protein